MYGLVYKLLFHQLISSIILSFFRFILLILILSINSSILSFLLDSWSSLGTLCCWNGKGSQVEVLNYGFEDLLDDNIEIDSEVASACNEDGGLEGKPGWVFVFGGKGGALDSGEPVGVGAALEPGGVYLGPCWEVWEVFWNGILLRFRLVFSSKDSSELISTSLVEMSKALSVDRFLDICCLERGKGRLVTGFMGRVEMVFMLDLENIDWLVLFLGRVL